MYSRARDLVYICKVPLGQSNNPRRRGIQPFGVNMADVEVWTVSEVNNFQNVFPFLRLIPNNLQPYLLIDCGLGEAPFYEEAFNRLRFVDIVKQKLHVIDLEKGPSSLTSFDLDVPVG